MIWQQEYPGKDARVKKLEELDKALSEQKEAATRLKRNLQAQQTKDIDDLFRNAVDHIEGKNTT
jgi:hypothetical protein